MVYVYCGTSASHPGWEQYWVFLMTGLAQRPMTLLVVPVPWALQKGWIKSGISNSHVLLFGGGQPNRHGCALPWILHPVCFSHRQRLGKFNPSTKRSRLMGRESYFESCICSERVITCSTNSSPVFFFFISLLSRAPLYKSTNSGTLDENTFPFWVNELSSQECFVFITYKGNIISF